MTTRPNTITQKSAPRSTVSTERSASPSGPASPKLRFIDLFCGIGGFRLAFERAGCECVFSCDWNESAQTTYEANFHERPWGDIHTVAVADILAHDILCGGFPCQPFSIAGVSKKLSLGRKHGFEDKEQGNLFFEIANIIEHHQPKAFVLENVKNLKSHDKGRTFEIIRNTLTEALGYTVYHKIIDAQSLVPQHRERLFLVGFREKRHFEFPQFPVEGPKLATILESNPDPKYTLSDRLWKYLQDYAAKHKAAGNGFGFGLFTPADVARTLSARYYKDGSEILISQGVNKNPRRLTPRECCRLMGFPENFKIPVSDTQAYKQFGNSVVVPVVERIATAVIETLRRPPNSIPAVARHKNDLSKPPAAARPIDRARPRQAL
jgi:DNA (cytosine-5)-methyltransferase 1